jgi:hypothetical protein
MFNGLTVLSLVLCVATVVLWVRGLSAAEVFSYWGHRYTVMFRSNLSTFGFVVGAHPRSETADWGYESFSLGTSLHSYWKHHPLELLGHFHWGSIGAGTPGAVRRMVLPAWLFLLMFAVSPVLWWLRWRLQHRPPVGCCTSCGYNLTGNVSGVCPECGTVIVKKTE